MGITYHGRYMDWFVIGRTELLRTIGLPYARLERSGLLLPVLEMNCQYLGATRYDDIVQLETTLTEVGRTRMAFRYEVWRLPATVETMPGSDDERLEGNGGGSEEIPTLVTKGETKHAFVDGNQRPFDVRKRHPDVWQVLQPFAAQLRSAPGDDIVAEGP